MSKLTSIEISKVEKSKIKNKDVEKHIENFINSTSNIIILLYLIKDLNLELFINSELECFNEKEKIDSDLKVENIVKVNDKVLNNNTSNSLESEIDVKNNKTDNSLSFINKPVNIVESKNSSDHQLFEYSKMNYIDFNTLIVNFDNETINFIINDFNTYSIQELLLKIRIFYLNNFQIPYSNLNDFVVSDKITTQYKYLNDDIEKFNINQGFEFIKNFDIFYKNNILPFICFENKIQLDFTESIGEIITIYCENNCFKITGSKIKEIANIPDTFDKNDLNIFQKLYKLLLFTRFKMIQKIFDKNLVTLKSNNKIDINDSNDINENSILFKNNKKIIIDVNGLRFKSEDLKIDIEISRILNTERDFVKYLKEVLE